MSKESRKLCDEITRLIAEEITVEIEDAFETAMEAFYYDYTPHDYYRTYSSFLASDHYNGFSNAFIDSGTIAHMGMAGKKLYASYKRFIKSPEFRTANLGYEPKVQHHIDTLGKKNGNRTRLERKGHSYIAGITVDSKNITGAPYYDHWGSVYWEYHPDMPPKEELRQNEKILNKGGTYEDFVFDRTFFEGIHGMSGVINVPVKDDYGKTKIRTLGKMEPTPHAITHRAYVSIVKNDNLAKKFDKYIDVYLDSL